MAFLILDVAAHNDLIPNENAKTDYTQAWIQKVEVWSPTPISLEKISDIIEVKIINRPNK